mgnify:CR=1 FL=1|tara:strand:+ start:3343 stop:4227 length:885 start_codon:yes stop_codon:yes gene_type:complete
MIIGNLKGGLGNQLFIYSFLYTLAKKNSTQFFFDLTNYNLKLGKSLEIDKLELVINECKKENLKNFRKISFFKLQEIVKEKLNSQILRDNVIYENKFSFNEFNNQYKKSDMYYLDGYWQNINSFSQESEYFKKIFKVKNIFLSRNYERLKQEIDSDPNAVCIHVRKNDYLNKNNSNTYSNINLEYYKKAISLIKKKKIISKIHVFTDDILWVKKNLHINNFILINDYNLTTVEEFEIMKKYKNIIISNSTFSLWAALLNENNDNIIIVPENWFIKNNKITVEKLLTKKMVVLKN